MGKKASRPPASKTSAASLAASGVASTGNKSSILKASFAPSDYQLALFASVIQGLDGQHLRIHDINTGRLQCEHVLGPKETITSLDWGYYPGRQKDRDQQAKKKRKRHSDVNGASDGFDQGDVVVAFGTSASDIRMYSPAEDKIVGTLAGGHDKAINDFKFTSNRPAQEGWSIGGDNKLVQWDLQTGKSTRMINVPASFTSLARPLPSNPPVLCASQTPYIIDIENGDSLVSFSAMRNSIQTLLTSSTESFATGLFLASDSDRYINIYDSQTQKLVMNLVADKEVSSLSLYPGKDDQAEPLEKQVLAAVTDDGTIELFTRPFVQPNQNTTNLKARGKQMTRRAEASVQIVQSEDIARPVSVVATAFRGPELLIAWAEGGVIPVFERVRWLNEETDELAFTGQKKLPKSKSSSVLASASTNKGKTAVETQVNESQAAVAQGNLVDDDVDMEDSNQDEVSIADSEDEESDDDEHEQPKKSTAAKDTQQKKSADSDVDMDNAAESDAEEEEEDETAEPSFGDLMRAHSSKEVDVEAEMEDDAHIGSLIPGKSNAAVQPIPSGVSLSTVLTQALKTNDTDMLESCLHAGELSIIRTTIQRLDSSLAATLLQKLAERLSARPGRYGHLLVWVQWTCVAHGGALAGKPDLLKRMATLFKVMDQRSSSLPSLLLLKGKLDMLDAQLGLRQSIRTGAEGMESEDEDNVIYVEGQEELEDDDSDVEMAKHMATPRTKLIRDQTFDEDESMMADVQSGADESDDEDDEGSDEEEDENEDVFDVEAEESAGSSDAEESPDEDEDDEDDEDAESAGSLADFVADTEDEESGDEELAASQPPSKKAKLGRGGGGAGKGKNKARK